MATTAPLVARAHPGDIDDPTVSPDPLWAMLATTTLSQTPPDYAYRPSHPPAVLALVGREIQVAGFIAPLEMGHEAAHFILSRYSPDCPYCPQGQPNEIIEVRAARPIRQQSKDLVHLKGRFALQDNGQIGLIFRLGDAGLA